MKNLIFILLAAILMVACEKEDDVEKGITYKQVFEYFIMQNEGDVKLGEIEGYNYISRLGKTLEMDNDTYDLWLDLLKSIK